MPVGELMARVTEEELMLWIGYLSYQTEEREAAEKRAARRR